MKRVVKRIDEMSRCHKDVLKRVGKVEDSLVKYVKDGNVADMKLTLDVFLMYMKNTVQRHREKEENVLFPFLRSIDYPKGDIDALIDDHIEIHKNVETLNLLKEMDYAEKDEVELRVSSLITVLRSHVEREEEILQATRDNLNCEGKIKF